ncbi:LysR family transcriptional regulator [Alcaligenaceae bacterium]|nr:LysR family transcriptional regulator [Alcaligenaceae bacterium]
MNLQQLKGIREILRQELNLTRAAQSLNLSQPALTRQLHLLEDHLGVPLLLRDKGRFTGLTEQSKLLMPIVARALDAVEDLDTVARELAAGATGVLTVGTGNTHARYYLPEAIGKFVELYPKVMLRIRQGVHQQVLEWVESGEIDFSISTVYELNHAALDFFPCYPMRRVVITRPGHPLLKVKKIALTDIVKYPLITYDGVFPARARIADAFHAAGLRVNVALSATDTEIVKTYVLSGLGVGIVSNTAFNPEYDKGLRAIDAAHLFHENMAYVTIRRGAAPSRHALKLIELLSPGVYSEIQQSRNLAAASA